MSSSLRPAKEADVPQIVAFLEAMQAELAEVPFEVSVVLDSVSRSFEEGVMWFLFLDEAQKPFGTCSLQSVHNYWRRGKRFYLGGFFIAPSHRGQGRLAEIVAQLRTWAEAQGAVQLYAHIGAVNTQSLAAFEKAGFKPTELRLCAYHWEGETKEG